MGFINLVQLIKLAHIEKLKSLWTNHFLGFAVLELNKFSMYETFCDKLEI